MKIVKKTTPNKNKGRNGYVPKLIVCHRTCGSFDGAVSWLCNKQSGASSHFVIAKDGRVAQLVDIKDTAWCNGTSSSATSSKYYKNSRLDIVKGNTVSANTYSVSIEFEGLADENGELTDKQFKAGVDVIRHIKEEVKRIYGYDIEFDENSIVGHCDVTPKWKPNCPGKAFPFAKLIDELKKGVYKVENKKYLVNGEVVEMKSINHEGYNYVQLRELDKLGLCIGYDESKKMAVVDTK